MVTQYPLLGKEHCRMGKVSGIGAILGDMLVPILASQISRCAYALPVEGTWINIGRIELTIPGEHQSRIPPSAGW